MITIVLWKKVVSEISSKKDWFLQPVPPDSTAGKPSWQFWVKEVRPDLSCKKEVITTQGGKILNKLLPEIGCKILSSQELECELLSGVVYYAVHSFKGLTFENPAALTVEWDTHLIAIHLRYNLPEWWSEPCILTWDATTDRAKETFSSNSRDLTCSYSLNATQVNGEILG